MLENMLEKLAFSVQSGVWVCVGVGVGVSGCGCGCEWVGGCMGLGV